jgi:autotransporter-associated beta strand protein
VANSLRNTASLTVNNGATLELGATNILVPDHGTPVAGSRVITANGSTLLMNASMDSRVGNIVLHNGATWTSNRGFAGWDVLLANTTAGAATVTVSGSGGATMNGSGGIHLQGIQNFQVADTTGNAAADLTVTMRLDDPGNSGGAAGGIRKTGAGTMLLNHTGNSYTGATTIHGGTLALGADNTLPGGSDVSIGAAVLDGATYANTAGTLDVTAAATIRLGTGGTLAFAGSSALTWSGTLEVSGDFVAGASLRFGTSSEGLSPTQLGLITVNGNAGPFALDANGYLVVAPTGFAAWQTANGTTGGIHDDHDDDGVANGIEFFLGGAADTSGFTPLPGVSDTDGVLSVTWTMAADYAGEYDIHFVVETSETLAAGSWNPVAASPTPAVADTVHIAGRDVTYTFPAGAGKFARLAVTGP